MKTLPIGERLKTLREAKNLSQSHLAKLCGWSSVSRIGNYEAGTRKISTDDAITIARALEISPAQLLFGEPSSPGFSYGVFLTEKQQEILDVFDGLPDEVADRFLTEMKEVKNHYEAVFEAWLNKRGMK